MISLIKKIINKFKDLYIYFLLSIKKRILFKDKFGLSYYLYKNTRPIDAFRRGVRTDDTTVLIVIKELINSNAKNKEFNCLDVGAFIGVITLMMVNELRRSHISSKVHSFEPFKETFSRLKDNIEYNQMTNNVVLNNIGLADKAGVQKMSINESSPGSNQLISNSTEDHTKVNQVEINTLDDYLNMKSIEHIHLCKIDAEGVDDLVLKGMHQYLDSNSVDYLILEYENAESQKNISKILEQYQFKVFYMVRNKNYLINNINDYPDNEESIINILAASSSANLYPINKLLQS
jgi:FkbM family methyltransferase